MSDNSASPIELMVLKIHEEELTDLMQTTIDSVKRSLFAKGLLARTNIAEEHRLLSKESRMESILEFVLILMEKESEEKSRQIFHNFLLALGDQPAWESLKDSLCKLMFQCYSQTVHARVYHV